MPLFLLPALTLLAAGVVSAAEEGDEDRELARRRRRLVPIRVYHGSDDPEIEEFVSQQPHYAYGGDLGAGVYVSPNPDVARVYGKHLYTFDLFVAPEGTSVLVGEQVPPFLFTMGGRRYFVGDEYGKEVLLRAAMRRLADGTPMETLVALDRIPDDVDAVEEHLEFAEEQRQKAIPWPSSLQQPLPFPGDLRRQAEQQWRMLSAVRDLADREVDDLILLDLDEIGQNAEAEGYRAVHMHGVRHDSRGLDEEILVLHPGDLVLVAKPEDFVEPPGRDSDR